ncbi:hypothetical protein NQ318_021157 [Aromia moschata]|uniref:Battenin n=1 Tax=Aromia moschata TaxID=1265417 RepID=A0AAV8YIB7_9CUCU|nr:hypothetical protein NQ318_021157 [Aromia moschata]
MTDYQSCATILPPTSKKFAPSRRKIRTLVAYWFLGLCNNYGYVVMLQLPMTLFLSIVVKLRVALCVILASAGYLTVAYSNGLILSLLGVVLTSFCSGLGEATYLQYSSFYDRNVVSSWSSGTGGAGVIGALSYAVLQAFGMRTTLLVMLIIPVFMAISFWIILPKPSEEDIAHALEIQRIVNREETKKCESCYKKESTSHPRAHEIYYPFCTSFELIQFENSSLTQQEQYRWLQVTYQIGVFLSRSSVNCFHIRQTWIMTVFQGINVVIFTTEVIFYYLPNFYVVIALTLWEGLLGGSSYVPEENKQFSMAITTFGDSIGIALAGIFAIYAHNKICDLPVP